MIHLITVKTGPRRWKVISSDLLAKYERPDKLIKKIRESEKEWIEDELKRLSGSE